MIIGQWLLVMDIHTRAIACGYDYWLLGVDIYIGGYFDYGYWLLAMVVYIRVIITMVIGYG